MTRRVSADTVSRVQSSNACHRLTGTDEDNDGSDRAATRKKTEYFSIWSTDKLMSPNDTNDYF